MMYKTLPVQLLAAVALFLSASHEVSGFVPAPSVRGHHLARASGRGATCSQGVKPLSAGAMGENTPEEDKLKARAAFADSSLMDNLMNMLNQLKDFTSGGGGGGAAASAAEEPAETAEEATEGEESASTSEVRLL